MENLATRLVDLLENPPTVWALYKMETGKGSITRPLLVTIERALKVADKSLVKSYDMLTEDEDNPPSEEAFDTASRISTDEYVQVQMTPGGSRTAWSVKGVKTEMRLVSAVLGSARLFVIVEESVPPVSPRQVMAFKRDAYPHSGRWLLLQGKEDPYQRAIRFIDPEGDPAALLSRDSDSEPYRLEDWTCLGWANGLAWGVGTVLLNAVVFGEGLGPKTFIPLFSKS